MISGRPRGGKPKAEPHQQTSKLFVVCTTISQHLWRRVWTLRFCTLRPTRTPFTVLGTMRPTDWLNLAVVEVRLLLPSREAAEPAVLFPFLLLLFRLHLLCWSPLPFNDASHLLFPAKSQFMGGFLSRSRSLSRFFTPFPFPFPFPSFQFQFPLFQRKEGGFPPNRRNFWLLSPDHQFKLP